MVVAAFVRTALGPFQDVVPDEDVAVEKSRERREGGMSGRSCSRPRVLCVEGARENAATLSASYHCGSCATRQVNTHVHTPGHQCTTHMLACIQSTKHTDTHR